MHSTYMKRLGPRELRIAIADVHLVEGDVNDIPLWRISRINVPTIYRGQGHGSELLRTILEDADRENVTIILEPLATGGLSQHMLEQWYMRHGFLWQNPTVGTYMIRAPRP